MSLLLDYASTEKTDRYNKIIVSNFQGKRAIFLEKYHYRELVNKFELNNIINNLIVNNGFLMDKQSNYLITFTHPKNDKYENSYFNFFPQTLEFEKITKTFLNFV